MNGPIGQRASRTLTPAVLASALFAAACAVFAVTFVAGRGGLQMPVAGTGGPVAVASESPGAAASPSPEPATPAPTVAFTAEPTVAPSLEPSLAPTPLPTAPGPTIDPNDPLAKLPSCPDHPGCFIYIVQRGDTFTGIVSRYLLSVTTVLALNPELSDPSLIVVGQTLYLGRDPFARLDPCPNAEPCSLYVVVAGDSITRIAARYGITAEAIREANPDLSSPIHAGDVLKLPHPTT